MLAFAHSLNIHYRMVLRCGVGAAVRLRHGGEAGARGSRRQDDGAGAGGGDGRGGAGQPASAAETVPGAAQCRACRAAEA